MRLENQKPSASKNIVQRIGVFELDYDIYVEVEPPIAEAKPEAYILLNLAGNDVIEGAIAFTYCQGK